MHRVQFVRLTGCGMLTLAGEALRKHAGRGLAYGVETGRPGEVSAA